MHPDRPPPLHAKNLQYLMLALLIPKQNMLTYFFNLIYLLQFCGSTNATICQRKKMVGDIFFCCPTPLSPPMLHPSLPLMQKLQHPMPSLLINFFGLTSFAYLS
jgi:hypothetical protein